MISYFATKIGPVQAQQDLLIRHRLLRKLHSYVGRKGMVIQAPAGYGKTSLLAQFTQDIEMPVCWLSLDESDRNPGHLLRHLFASIVETFPVRNQDMDWQYSQVGGPSSGWEDPLATLVANINHTIPEMFILILDDLHIIDDQPEAIALIDALVSHLPENVYLIISSRTKPPPAVPPAAHCKS